MTSTVPTKDHAVPALANDHAVPALANDHAVPALANDHAVPALANDHAVPALANDHAVPALANDHAVPASRRPGSRRLPRWLCAGLALTLAACEKQDQQQVKNLKEQVQVAFGNKEFAKALDLSQKGFALAHQDGGSSTDALYFAQSIAENDDRLHNYRAEIPALKQEIALRAAARQTEKKLQPRRTKLIQLAQENGDPLTVTEQAVAVSRGINMATGKDPQPVYKTTTEYPADLYRQKVEGDVQVDFGLDAAGQVTEARVVKATPPRVFDQAALESFRKWRFTPMLDSTGQPVQASGFTFTIAFRMGRQ